MFTGWWGQRTIVTWTSEPFDETFEVLYKPDSTAWRCIWNNQILILKQAVQAEAERDLSSAETLTWIITFPLIWSRFGPSFSPNDVITSVFFCQVDIHAFETVSQMDLPKSFPDDCTHIQLLQLDRFTQHDSILIEKVGFSYAAPLGEWWDKNMRPHERTSWHVELRIVCAHMNQVH